jgi:Protein of unknown function (DUF3047)
MSAFISFPDQPSASSSPSHLRLIRKWKCFFLNVARMITPFAFKNPAMTTVPSLFIKACAAAGLLCFGSACTTVDPEMPLAKQPASDVRWVSALQAKERYVTWQHRAFPGKKQTNYRAILHDGRRAVRSESSAAASMLRESLRVEAGDLGKVSFSWKVPALIANADLTQPDTSDSPVRLVLAFEGDRAKFSAKNAMVSELALALTGEPLPYATLMYVWGTQRAPGSIILSHRTDRIRKLVLESGPQHLGRWLDYERDIKADFEKAFGEAPGALVGIGIMTDTDNTRGQARAWYGPISLVAKGSAPATASSSGSDFVSPATTVSVSVTPPDGESLPQP